MQALLDLVEATKDEVRALAADVDAEKLSSNAAAEELSQWEERLRNCKESQDELSVERSKEACSSTYDFFNLIAPFYIWLFRMYEVVF